MKIYKIKVNGKAYKVEVESIEEVASEAKVTVAAKPEVKKTVSAGEGAKVTSPIQGTVNEVKVKVGDHIKKGQVVAVVEAMKLANDIVSGVEGEVSEVLVNKGQQVSANDAIVVVK